jgi:outer membrane protein OmpA-like peptidoglycan-associated protein
MLVLAFTLSLSAIAADEAEVFTPDLNAQLFRHSVDSERTLWVDDAGHIEKRLTFETRFATNWVEAPLVVYRQRETLERTAIVSRALEMDFIGSLAINRFRLGAHIPVYALAQSDLDTGGGGLGDVALDFRTTIMDRYRAPLGIAIAATVDLPTATLALPLANPNGKPSYSLGLIADRQFGPVLLAANFGTRWLASETLPNVAWGNQGFARFGAGYAITDATGLSFDTATSFTYARNDSATHGANVPWEMLFGGWHAPHESLVVRAGLGMGLTRGIGAPKARAVLSLAYQPHERKKQAPQGTNEEIMFGELEVRAVSTTGEPLPDAHITVNGDPLGVGQVVAELKPGTYDVEATAPGYDPGGQSAEVHPDDRAVVVIELAPTGHALLQGNWMTLSNLVLFDTAKSVLKPESQDILSSIANVLVDHPELALLRIEGHADRRGTNQYNASLSQQRAHAVRTFLIEHGVEASRLVAVGFGESLPSDPTDSPEGWARNRRVVFFVERRTQ